MLNIKKGDVLKWKEDLSKGEAKVLAVCDGVYALSKIIEHEVFDAWYTENELRKAFILPEEKWQPERGCEYWYIDDLGEVTGSEREEIDEEEGFTNLYFKRRDLLGIYRTKEEAEAKLKEILAVLKK